MKKTSPKKSDEMRSGYKRSDFQWLERGRYADRVVKDSNIVVIDDDLRKPFPNEKAVNRGLRKLLKLTQDEPKSAKQGAKSRERTRKVAR